jgi:hypothetical protein
MARPNKPLQPTAYNLSLRAVKVGGGSCAGLERNTARQVSGKSHDQAAEALAGVTSATGMEGQNKDD